MKFVGLSTIALVLVSTANVAVAKSCVSGGMYCGQSLINRGDYRNDIIKELQKKGQPTDEAHILKSLFPCFAAGMIQFYKYCSAGCGGVGSTKDDYCL